MFGLGNKKPEAKAQREAENILADLRIELQDADINLINLNNNGLFLPILTRLQKITMI